MQTYARYPLFLARGDGMRAFEADGRSFLDFAGGLGALSLGHCHPVWLEAVREQAATIGLVSNLYATEPQARLAERLAELLPIPDARVFLANSGAEANEAAIKLARKRGLSQGRPKIVALEGSFHGRTVATLAATGQPGKREAFEPLVDWFVHVPPGDLEAMRDALGAGDVCAVLLEPVMGEGGVRPLPHEYLQEVRALCDEHDVLLVADEVQSGSGRCGDWLAASLSGVVPDVATLAKGLGGGLPIGACISRAGVAFGPGEHASTFGGGPIPCAAALAVLDTIERQDLLANAREIGGRLRDRILVLTPDALVTEVRGRGLLIGVQLAEPVAHEVVLAMIDEGVLATEAGPDVVRMSPPLVVTPDEADEAVDALVAALGKVAAARGWTA
ncbi:MAG: acetylornithine transaminase [Actinobacteria bacterium]|nr:acetylornithine transaminase [Actinomycetota bacterium]